MFRRPFGSFTSPWREMDRLRREMNRLLADWPSSVARGVAPRYPAINVWMSEDGVIVTAELPGVNPEDLDISVENDTLTLSGSRQPKELEEGETYHRRERTYGRFSRVFQLPIMVRADAVEATFKNGVLRISLPRAEEDKPKKIAVKTG